jgi:hypothetical protein
MDIRGSIVILPVLLNVTLFCPESGAAAEDYLGARACQGCHPKQFATQSRSHHAGALHRGSEASQFAYLAEGRINAGATYDFVKTTSDYRVESAWTASGPSFPSIGL